MMMMDNDPRPGWKTTEFWATAATALSGVLLASGAVGPEVASATAEGIRAVGGLVMATATVIGYIASRVRLKGG